MNTREIRQASLDAIERRVSLLEASLVKDPVDWEEVERLVEMFEAEQAHSEVVQ